MEYLIWTQRSPTSLFLSLFSLQFHPVLSVSLGWQLQRETAMHGGLRLPMWQQAPASVLWHIYLINPAVVATMWSAEECNCSGKGTAHKVGHKISANKTPVYSHFQKMEYFRVLLIQVRLKGLLTYFSFVKQGSLVSAPKGKLSLWNCFENSYRLTNTFSKFDKNCSNYPQFYLSMNWKRQWSNYQENAGQYTSGACSGVTVRGSGCFCTVPTEFAREPWE